MTDPRLTPDISQLSWETLELIKHGVRGDDRSQCEARLKVCIEMIHAGYGVPDIWAVMTEPGNGISRVFFESIGEEAEDLLEQIISEADAAAKQPEGTYG